MLHRVNVCVCVCVTQDKPSAVRYPRGNGYGAEALNKLFGYDLTEVPKPEQVSRTPPRSLPPSSSFFFFFLCSFFLLLLLSFSSFFF